MFMSETEPRLEGAAGKSHCTCAMTWIPAGVGRGRSRRAQEMPHGYTLPTSPLLLGLPISGPGSHSGCQSLCNPLVAPGKCLLETCTPYRKSCCLDHTLGLWHSYGCLLPAHLGSASVPVWVWESTILFQTGTQVTQEGSGLLCTENFFVGYSSWPLEMLQQFLYLDHSIKKWRACMQQNLWDSWLSLWPALVRKGGPCTSQTGLALVRISNLSPLVQGWVAPQMQGQSA